MSSCWWLLVCAGPWHMLVVFSSKIEGIRNAGHSDLQRTDCARMHFCSFSICQCCTDISDCTGWVAADLLFPLTLLWVCNHSTFLFFFNVTGLHCCYRFIQECHHHIFYVGHLQYLRNMSRADGLWAGIIGMTGCYLTLDSNRMFFHSSE